MRYTRGRLGVSSLLLACACTGALGESGDGAVRVDSGHDASADSGTPSADTGSVDARDSAAGDVGSDAGEVDPCGGALFCERFDDYGLTTLTDGQTFGPWRASLQPVGSTMDLSSTHTVSGSRALHIRIDNAATAGGRLHTTGVVPVLAGTPTHLYGRMMMYIDPNGSSVHWTFFGVDGNAERSSPVTGRHASYLMSSLPRSDVNTYSFVDGLESSGADPYHDCWFQSMEPMPASRWTCVAFELDSVARRLRLYRDGSAAPVLSVDDHGQGCVGTIVPGDSPWYGPSVDEFYVGAWSFHPMTSPLEVWIDDVVVDTRPVLCPTP